MGGPGSGKTTLARELSTLIGAEYIELDLVAFPAQGPGIPLKSDSELSAEVSAIQEKGSWVVEGMYTGWTDPLIYGADFVIWLDPPWPVAVWRVVWRHIKSEIRRNNRNPGWKRLWWLLPSVRRWYTREPNDVRNHLDAMGYARSTTEHYATDLGDKMIRKARLRADEALGTLGFVGGPVP